MSDETTKFHYVSDENPDRKKLTEKKITIKYYLRKRVQISNEKSFTSDGNVRNWMSATQLQTANYIIRSCCLFFFSTHFPAMIFSPFCVLALDATETLAQLPAFCFPNLYHIIREQLRLLLYCYMRSVVYVEFALFVQTHKIWYAERVLFTLTCGGA